MTRTWTKTPISRAVPPVSAAHRRSGLARAAGRRHQAAGTVRGAARDRQPLGIVAVSWPGSRRPSEPDLGLVLAWVEAHFLISTTMLVVGLFAVLSWESMFPDRRDVLVLSPLPVRGRTLFLAKVAAVATALSLTVLALNIFPGLAAPFVFAAAPTLPPPTLRSGDGAGERGDFTIPAGSRSGSGEDGHRCACARDACGRRCRSVGARRPAGVCLWNGGPGFYFRNRIHHQDFYRPGAGADGGARKREVRRAGA